VKLFLGLLESAAPHQTRIFGEFAGKLVDLNLAYSGSLHQSQGNSSNPYELAAFYFPETITGFLHLGEVGRRALAELTAFLEKNGVTKLSGPDGERVIYGACEIRILPPLQNPEKSFVIGFSDRARIEAIPQPEIPTGFYKLPQTFVASGKPIVLPKFSEEVDADACLAIVIGKAGRRIAPKDAWDHVAGVTLVIDITARDVNRREGATTNNLLGKNFPSSTAIGPGILLTNNRDEIESLRVDLSLDGETKQQFTLRDCVFTIEQIIARWSILGIKPGDWLAIGASMAMQGDRLQNPVPLKPGAKLRCSVAGIGESSHEVVRQEARR